VLGTVSAESRHTNDDLSMATADYHNPAPHNPTPHFPAPAPASGLEMALAFGVSFVYT